MYLLSRYNNTKHQARMAESADAADLKFASNTGVSVQIRLWVLNRKYIVKLNRAWGRSSNQKK